jgi:hypothetical protein
MAGRYGATVGANGINVVNSVLFQLRPTAATIRLRIIQLGVAVITAPTNAPQFALVRSTAIGATPTSTLAGQPLDPADPTSLATMDAATFATPPTVSTTALIAGSAMATTIGGGWLWDYSAHPLVVPANTANGLCLLMTGASGATLGAFRAWALWDE